MLKKSLVLALVALLAVPFVSFGARVVVENPGTGKTVAVVMAKAVPGEANAAVSAAKKWAAARGLTRDGYELDQIVLAPFFRDILLKAEGYVTKDNINAFAMLFKKSTGQSAVPVNYRLFVVVRGDGGLLLQDAAASGLEVVNPAAVYTEPPEISAAEDVLIIKNVYGSRERSTTTLKFRYTHVAKSFLLIGQDQVVLDTLSQKTSEKSSINLLTGDMILNGKKMVFPTYKNMKVRLEKCDFFGVEVKHPETSCGL